MCTGGVGIDLKNQKEYLMEVASSPLPYTLGQGKYRSFATVQSPPLCGRPEVWIQGSRRQQ